MIFYITITPIYIVKYCEKFLNLEIDVDICFSFLALVPMKLPLRYDSAIALLQAELSWFSVVALCDPRFV
jgi:hypothetical protein